MDATVGIYEGTIIVSDHVPAAPGGRTPFEVRLTLARDVDGAPHAAWSEVCAQLFRVKDAREALRLWHGLPLSVVVEAAGDDELALLRKRLERAHVRVEVSPVRLNHQRCERHPRLCSDHICPRCREAWVCLLCDEFERARGCARCVARERARRRFTQLRVAILLWLLLAVFAGTVLGNLRLTSWKTPVTVNLMPIPVEKGVEGDAAALEVSDFVEIGSFLAEQALRHGREGLPPINFVLSAEFPELPPERPLADAPWYEVAAWSLGLRAWMIYASVRYHLPSADARAFLLYYSPRPGRVLPDSLGLQAGHVVIANLFAGRGWVRDNNVVLAHELLHLFGATDKYDEAGLPLYPNGYAEPEQRPLWPQEWAEIMAGRIARSANQAVLPRSLDECVVGAATAAEIGWIGAPQ